MKDESHLHFFDTEEGKKISAELDADMERRLQALDDEFWEGIGLGLLGLLGVFVFSFILGCLIHGGL